MSAPNMDEGDVNLIELSNKLKTGEYKIGSKRGRSAVWTTFGNLLDDANNLIDGVVACRICLKVLKLFKTTTTNLHKHVCHREKTENKIEINQEDKIVIKRACTQWVIQDNVPFVKVDGVGLKLFIEKLLLVSSHYEGTINVEHMLPHSTTVSNDISHLREKYHPIIKSKLKNVKFFAGTCDLWSDSYKHMAYISITIHYIENAKLNERVLAVRYFNYNKQTGQNIRAKVVNILNIEYGIDPDNCIFVTDRGANIKNAFLPFVRLSCADHIINNILNAATESIEEIKTMLQNCKQLVRYFKKSTNLQQRLKTTLKSACITRWNSQLEMIDSIKNNWTDIYLILSEKQQLDKIRDIKIEEIEQISIFLLDFKKASLDLESTSYPTLHRVIPHMEYLMYY